MKKSVLDLRNFGTIELQFNEMLLIDGGSFWSVVGGICAVAAIVACVVFAPEVAIAVIAAL